MERFVTNRLSQEISADEAELWVKFRSGDLPAFEMLYRTHHQMLVRYGVRLLSDIQRVEDAIHDVFMDLWRRRAHLSDVAQPRFYLYQALRNQLIRNGRNDIFETSQSIDNFREQTGTHSAEQLQIETETVADLQQRVQQALEGLSPRQREAVILRFYHGFNLGETAELMKLSKQSVSNLLFKAYPLLRIAIRLLILVLRAGGF